MNFMITVYEIIKLWKFYLIVDTDIVFYFKHVDNANTQWNENLKTVNQVEEVYRGK